MWKYFFFGVRVTCLPFRNLSDDKLKQIYKIRKNAFIDRRRWQMDSYDGSALEVDQFDNEHSYYLFHEKDRSITGCVRLIPSNMPNLLGGALEYVTGGKRVNFHHEHCCWEASRFCLKPHSEDNHTGKKNAYIRTYAMFMSMIAFGADFGIHEYEIVVDEPMRRVLNMCGWSLSIINKSKGSFSEDIYYGTLTCSFDCQESIRKKAIKRGVMLQYDV